VSESLLSNADSTDAGVVDSTIQRMWDRYAMADQSFELDSVYPPRAFTSPRFTSAANATKIFDSLPELDSATAPSDAFAKAESIDLADEGFDVVLRIEVGSVHVRKRLV